MSKPANLGIEEMHKRNAYNFSLDLIAGEAVLVAMIAPITHALCLEGAFLMKL
ncbi:MAG: hypothetical protein V7L29_34710 [Nostoc sp.]|uniref:hypothetical protein n=1 Tax=Nostoc sp. TaxID=1180 RepID=UPI002FF92021